MTAKERSDVANAYARWAASYDADHNRTRDLDRDVLAAWLRGRRFAAVIEAGCGTGKNTGALVAVAERVHALDLSPAMLAIARDKVRAANVTFGEADLARPWPVADGAADLVTFDLVLEHVAGLEPVFAFAARALRPGGLLAVTELHPARQYEGKRAHFERDGAIVEVPAFVHHVTDYLRAAERAGCELVELREHWHADDVGRSPRLLACVWRRCAEGGV